MRARYAKHIRIEGNRLKAGVSVGRIDCFAQSATVAGANWAAWSIVGIRRRVDHKGTEVVLIERHRVVGAGRRGVLIARIVGRAICENGSDYGPVASHAFDRQVVVGPVV